MLLQTSSQFHPIKGENRKIGYGDMSFMWLFRSFIYYKAMDISDCHNYILLVSRNRINAFIKLNAPN